MKTRFFYLCIWIVLVSCEAYMPPDRKALPQTNNVAVINGTQYISHGTSELIFETEVVVMNYYYDGFDNDYLDKEDFDITGSGTYTIESFKFVPFNNSTRSSIVMLLMDQSGSYEAIDPHNARSQAITKFLYDISLPDKFLIGASARQGKLLQEPVEFSDNEFGNDPDTHRKYVFDLSKRTGGSGVTLDAADRAMDKLIAHAGTVRRELVLLVHSIDESMVAVNTLISKALSSNIRVHTIMLGEIADKNVFGTLSQQTGGMFAVRPGDKELVKVFSELERLLNGTKEGYKIRIRYKPYGTIQLGTSSIHTLVITDPFSGELYNSLFPIVKVP